MKTVFSISLFVLFGTQTWAKDFKISCVIYSTHDWTPQQKVEEVISANGFPGPRYYKYSEISVSNTNSYTCTGVFSSCRDCRSGGTVTASSVQLSGNDMEAVKASAGNGTDFIHGLRLENPARKIRCSCSAKEM